MLGEGVAGRIAAALRRILQSVGRDEAEARAAIIQPRDMAGAEELAERAQAVRNPGLPESVRPMVEAWTTQSKPHAPAPEVSHPHRPQKPDLEEAGRRVESYLRDCRDHLDEGTAIALSGDGIASAGTPEPDARIDRTEALRREGLRLLGEGELRAQLQAVTGERIAALEGIGEMQRRVAGRDAEAVRAGEKASGRAASKVTSKEGGDPAAPSKERGRGAGMDHGL